MEHDSFAVPLSPFALAYKALLDKNLCVIPIGPGTKSPGRWNGQQWGNLNWKTYQDRLPTEAEAAMWAQWPDAGVGMILGKVSGLIALDFDYDVDGLHAKIEGIIPPSPCKKVGKKGYTAFYRYNGEVSHSFKVNGQVVLEVLTTGKQTVLPPSIHPDTGQAYQWYGESLGEVNIQDLPILSSEVMEALKRVLEEKQQESMLAFLGDTTAAYQAPALADFQEILDWISPDPYETWVWVGMALKKDFGESAFSVWDDWSRKSAKYPKPGQPSTMDKWKSFKRLDGRGIGSIFYEAKKNGWRPGQPTLEELVHMEANKYALKRLKPDQPTFVEFSSARMLPVETPFPVHLLDAPGIVGKLAKWMTVSAIRPQPVLALGMGIGIAGTLYAHRIQSSSGLRTNMLIMNLAPSGSGKGHPQNCAVVLFNHLGLEESLGGRSVSSGTALVNRVHIAKGRVLFPWDEFGRALSDITNPRAPAHARETLTVIMEMFSSADRVYRGKEFATTNNDENKRKDIDQPCLCIVGSTVPEHYYDSLTKREAMDGFLARWMVFESYERKPPHQSGQSTLVPPDDLLEVCKAINEMPTNIQPEKGNIAALKIMPKVIELDEAAQKLMGVFIKYCEERGDDEFERGSGCDPLWARAPENAMKLALCAHEDGVITEKVMRWAAAAVDFLTKRSIGAIQRFVWDNPYQADMKKFIATLEELSGVATHSQIMTKLKWKAYQLKEVVESLEAMHALHVHDQETKGRSVKIYTLISNPF